MTETTPQIYAPRMPHDDVSEDAVLGMALIERSVAARIVGELSPDDFYRASRARIFESIRQAAERDEGYLNPLSIAKDLEERGIADAQITIVEMIEGAASDADELEMAIGSLKRSAEARTVVACCSSSIGSLSSGHDSLEDVIDSLGELLEKTTARRKDSELYDAGFNSGVKATLQQLDGLLHEGIEIEELQAWVDRQWEDEAV